MITKRAVTAWVLSGLVLFCYAVVAVPLVLAAREASGLAWGLALPAAVLVPCCCGCVPPLTCWADSDKKPSRLPRCLVEWNYWIILLPALPLLPTALDLFMVPFTFCEARGKKLGGKQLSVFLSSYLAVRALSEALFESLPQLAFQIHAFLYCRQEENECGFETAAGGVLVQSMITSCICIIGQIATHCRAKREMGEKMTWSAYGKTLWRLGGGMRLHEVRASFINELTISIPLDEALASVLGQAVDAGRAAFVRAEAAAAAAAASKPPGPPPSSGLQRLDVIVLDGEAARNSILKEGGARRRSAHGPAARRCVHGEGGGSADRSVR